MVPARPLLVHKTPFYWAFRVWLGFYFSSNPTSSFAVRWQFGWHVVAVGDWATAKITASRKAPARYGHTRISCEVNERRPLVAFWHALSADVLPAVG
jgi:hypothetical protein